MSYRFAAVAEDGSVVVVNSDDYSKPTNIGGDAPTLHYMPAFSTFSTLSLAFPSYGQASLSSQHPQSFFPYESYPGFPRGQFDNGALAPIRKKRKTIVFDEEEATCAKCHYRRKCMKCINCMARFCEQRCLARYLDDLAEQEDVRLTNTWLCPCCRGIEPVDLPRTEEKEEEESEAEASASTNAKEAPSEAPTPTKPAITTDSPAAKNIHPRAVPTKSATEPKPDAPEPETKISPGSEIYHKNPVETEDDFCAVCGDAYSYDNNDIIFCEGCNVAAHQACYGVARVPDGDWHCDRCIAKTSPQCHLCGLKGGAMKQILEKPHYWIHVTCVATLYECSPLELDSKIGPVGLLDKIDKRRFKLKCEICKEKNRKEITGPLIQCAAKKCTKAFHPVSSLLYVCFTGI